MSVQSRDNKFLVYHICHQLYAAAVACFLKQLLNMPFDIADADMQLSGNGRIAVSFDHES